MTYYRLEPYRVLFESPTMPGQIVDQRSIDQVVDDFERWLRRQSTEFGRPVQWGVPPGREVPESCRMR